MHSTPKKIPELAVKTKEPSRSTQKIERKWLVTTLPDLTDVMGKDIIQGYITLTSDGTEVRFRQIENQYFQTVKSAGDLVRDEIEVALTESQYKDLWRATANRRVEKTRYEVPWNAVIIEIDIYKGALAGLIVAEVEFASVSASQTFSPPAWFSREVPEDKEFENKHLALSGLRGSAPLKNS